MIIFYPDHVKLMFKLLQFTNIDFKLLADFFRDSIPADLINTPSFNLRFYNFGVQTTLFLDNCASLIMSFFLSLIVLLICFILYKTIWCEKVKSFFQEAVSSYFFNNFLRFVAEGYLELSFGAFLNVISFNISTTSEIISLTVAALITIICIVFPFIAAAQLYDKRKQIADENQVYLKRFGTIFRDFKIEGDWIRLQFYPFFMIRRMTFVIFLIVLIEYPEIQCNMLIFFSCLSFFFNAMARPFHHEVVNLMCTINEGLIFSIAFIQIVFITDVKSVFVITSIGWSMIAATTFIISLNFGIIFTFSLYTKIKARINQRRISNWANWKPEDTPANVQIKKVRQTINF